jgi:3-hydroxyacyl-CoA dehydrogenase
MDPIRKVAVIGSGVMGSGIAAQVANAGIPVLLLDIVPEGANDRNTLAAGAIARMLKTEPAPLMHPRAAGLITPGNIEDDLAALAECDWIVEAVVERLAVKQALYRRIEAARRPGSAVSSNTSTIRLHQLMAGMPESLARDFLITHFFNPPRYMQLLELVAGPQSDAAQVARLARFGDAVLGKTIVHCNDSPGFIANRLGVFWMQCAATLAYEQGIGVEVADAVLGRPMGVPKTGVFGLLDLVGLDLMPDVSASMAAALPENDAFHSVARELPLLRRMIAEGYTGRKGKGGFYRLERAGRTSRKLALDLASGEYRPAAGDEPGEIAAHRGDLRGLLSAPGPVGAYAWGVMARTLAYAAGLLPEAAGDVDAIDTAMRLGFNWKAGPFELIDSLGAAWFAERLAASGMAVPPLLTQLGARRFYRVEGGRVEGGLAQYYGLDDAYHDIPRPEGVLLLADVKRAAKPVLKNGSAALWDIGQGVACFEFTSKMNALDGETIALLGRAIETVAQRFRALVIYSEAKDFSVGANLGLALFAANIAAWGEVEKALAAGQRVLQALAEAPFPVVAAPAGMALGGGCEILLHADAIVAHAETYAGLVECGVGLIPGWGGSAAMLRRGLAAAALPKGPMPAVARAFEMISTAQVSKSAAEAREMLILRPDDRITMNRARLLADARARALELAVDYRPPAPPGPLALPGPSGRAALRLAAEGMARRGLASAHDLRVADALAGALTGGEADLTEPCTQEALLGLERAAFIALLQSEPTLARIEHTLETGKPLRN